jgi:precorrin-6B methylase 2
MSERNLRLSRRKFLLTVGAGSAATAAAVVATKKSSQATTSGSGKRESRGYHATEHVNNYYRTAKV